ncbi:hypothetical protein OG730_34825 [Streptomyces sp. NBC_01298]|uniref:hypothetical protein n=1 Tax=Streptomyces sp. NBC_01298 TaxID=2903817 RepID=UPI002E114D14|nr:hypothetical protein OG730_34825 [Streptomyces sp. NBC_01298]
MPDRMDEPGICPDCDGLVVTTWNDLTPFLRSISYDGGPEVHAEVWIAMAPEPCDKPQPPTA